MCISNPHFCCKMYEGEEPEHNTAGVDYKHTHIGIHQQSASDNSVNTHTHFRLTHTLVQTQQGCFHLHFCPCFALKTQTGVES